MVQSPAALTPDEIVAMLQMRGLVDADWLRGGWRLAFPHDPHNVALVSHKDGLGLAVKQPFWSENGGNRLVRREAAFLELAAGGFLGASIKRIIPALVSFEEADSVLVTRYNPGEDFTAFHHRVWSGDDRAVIQAARRSASALALLHDAPIPVPLSGRASGFWNGSPPWVLGITQPGFTPPSMEWSSAGIQTLLATIQNEPRLGPPLLTLKTDWSAESIIHGDIKWSNMVRLRSGRVLLIDWEHVELGQPYWDTGSFLHSYLAFWICALPLNQYADPREAISFPGWSLSLAQRAIREFWQSYIKSRRAALPADFLAKSIAAAGARLLQTACEQARAETVLSTQCAMMLQTSLNILCSPEKAVATFFGSDTAE